MSEGDRSSTSGSGPGESAIGSPGARAHLGTRPGGRSARVRTAIFGAATEELVEVGYADLTLTSIAARAGVAPSTVRRRWGTKDRLVAAAIVEATADQVGTPDTGSLEGDLRAFGRSVVDYHADAHTHAMLKATLALPKAQLDEVRAQTWAERARVSRAILRRALERGEIPRQRDAARIIEMLVAPIWLRALITGAPVTDADLDGFVADALAAAVEAPPPTGLDHASA